MTCFRTKTAKKLLYSSDFNCPQRQQTKTYEKPRAKNWFRLYFIPLIPLKEYPPYVEREVIIKLIGSANSEPEMAEKIVADFGTRLNVSGQELVMKAILLFTRSGGSCVQEEKDMANAIGKALGMSNGHMKGILAKVSEQ